MKRLAIVATMVSVCLSGAVRTLDGAQSLSLEVSPTVAPAPALVRVRALVEASDDNRSLEIVAQSADFYRSSRVELEGRGAPRLAVFEYPNLPPGRYEVTAVLFGTAGRRATALRLVNIVQMTGR